MDKLLAMKAFVTVADEGSFTKAGDKLNLSTQLISKYVSQLEDYLNSRLLNRTTRRVHITEEGQVCLQHARQLLNFMDDMEGYFSEIENEAKGLLSISAPVSFATLHLSKLICDFKAVHSKVGINLQLNDRKVDVVEEGYDVAFRIGQLKSSSLFAKKLAPIKLVIAASPEYLEKFGMPETPEQLNIQHYLSYSYMELNQTNSKLSHILKESSNNQSSISANNGEILVQAAIAGEGFTIQPTFIVGEALRQGQLKRILIDYEPEPLGLYMVYPHRKLMSSRLRAFVDFCSDYYGHKPYWDNQLS